MMNIQSNVTQAAAATVIPMLGVNTSALSGGNGPTLIASGVPPGRYKYTSAKKNGKQGVLLTPISDWATSNDSGVFLPFEQAQPQTNASAGSVLPGTNKSTGSVLSQTSKSTGSALSQTSKSTGSVLSQTSKSTGSVLSQTNKSTGSALSQTNMQSVNACQLSSTHSQPFPNYIFANKHATIGNVGSYSSISVGNSKTGYVSTKPVFTPRPNNPMLVINNQQTTTNARVIKTFPTVPNAQSHRFVMNVAPPGKPLVVVQDNTTKYPFPVESVNNGGHVNYPNVGVVNRQETVLPNGSSITVPLQSSASSHLSSSNTLVTYTRTHPSPAINDVVKQTSQDKSLTETTFQPASIIPPECVDPNRPIGKLLIHKSEANQHVCLEQSGSNLTENSSPADNLTFGTSEVSFKIDSVFSLSSSTPSDHWTPLNEPAKENDIGCSHDKECFVVLESLNLNGLSSVDVRKFRKITGRHSCSPKCRQSTVRRYCPLKRLHIEKKAVVIDFAIGADFNFTNDELKELESYLKVCKPAPRAAKLQMFISRKRRYSNSSLSLDEMKMYPPSKKAVKNIPSAKSFETKYVPSEKLDQGEKSIPGLPESLLKSDIQLKKPTNRNKLQPTKLETSQLIKTNAAPNQYTSESHVKKKAPPIDVHSPEIQKAITALGCKKFFLIRVEGKNILMPVEQNSVVPRAYVLGESNAGVKTMSDISISSATVSRNAPQPMKGSSTKQTIPTVRVKTEPPDNGYETKSSTATKTMTPGVKIKTEKYRGYPDEVDPNKKKTIPCTTQQSEINSGLNSENQTTTPPTIPISTQPTPKPVSSVEKIRQLKALLKQKEQELAVIKETRLKSAADVRQILDDEDP